MGGSFRWVMKGKDVTMPQEFKQYSSSTEPREATSENQEKENSSSIQEEKASLDSVLDDVETTLEGNAEEYVKGFVQEGGE